jgi:hypothetical protein
MPSDSSDVSGLLARVERSSAERLAFYARRILGLRGLAEARLDALQAGAPARSAHERFALRRWLELGRPSGPGLAESAE